MPEAGRPGRAATLALLAIVALGAALRFATLGDRSFWLDEAFTVRMVDRSFGGMLHVWRLHESNPPLNPVLAWLWARAFGTGEFAIRSLSALVGTATIPLAYVVTARLATRRAGLVAALVVSVSALDVWFSQDARPYAVVVLTGGLSFWAFLRALDIPSRGRLAVWAGASVLAVLSHYFAIYLVAGEAVWLLAAHPGRRRPTLAASAVPAATLGAMIPIALDQRSTNEGIPFLGLTSTVSRAAQIPAQYVVGFQPPAQVAVSAAAFLAVPVAAWLLLRRTEVRERRGGLVAATVGGVALLGPLVVALLPGLDFVYTRYTASAFVPLAAAISIGLAAQGAGALGAAALAWLCGFSLAVDVITADHSKFDHEDWRAAARAIPPADGRRVVAVTPPAGVNVLPLYLSGARRLDGAPGSASEVDVIGLPPAIRRIGHEPVPPRPPSPPAPPGFRLVERRDAPTFTLVRYRATRPVALSRARLDALELSRRGRRGPSLLALPAGGVAK